MADFVNAIKRPFTDVKALLIGIGLSIIPIINFFASGYIVRATNGAMNKKMDMPEWSDWGKLFVNGLLLLVIGIVYFLPVIILGLITGSAVIASIVKGNYAALGSAGLGLGITGLLALVLIYIAPSAICAFAVNGVLGDAFKFGDVFRKAFTGEYFVTWAVMFVYTLVVTGVASLVPFIGPAVASFITGVSMFTALGEIYPKL